MASTPDKRAFAAAQQRAIWSEAAAQSDEREAFRARAMLALFLFGMLGVTVFQKIGYVTGGSILPIVIPLVLGSVAVGLLVLKPVIDPLRVALYAAAIGAAGLSTIFLSPVYSSGSFILFVVLYLPLLVSFDVTEVTYRRCMDAFVTLMLCFCGVIAIEHLVQFLVGPEVWPNLNKLLPPQWLIPEYNYLQPIVWSLPYHKPNAAVFLEVSLLSQYVALALAVEIALFQRPARLAILAGGLMATFAGTGVLLMALTLPVLLGRLTIRQSILVIAALTVIAYVAFKIGWFDIVSERMDEYKHNGSSANMRFIEPLDRLLAFLGEGNPLFGGIGAGQIEKGHNFQWWPFTKATIEYGLIPGMIFYGFFLYALFKDAPYKTIAFVLAVWYTFEGALLTAVNPLTCLLLSMMFHIRRDGAPAPAGGVAVPLHEKPSRRRVDAAAVPVAAAALSPRAVPEAPVAAPPASIAEADAPVVMPIAVPSTAGRLVYAIGDVHGRADLLAPLIAAIAEDAAREPAADGTQPMLVFLGDYIDRGRRSRDVIDQIIALQADPAWEVRALLGNHEEAMLAYLDGSSTGVSFGRYGGRQTLESYGVAPPSEAEGKEAWEAVRPAFREAVPAAHVAFLRALELMVTIGDCLFVHAGVRAGVPLDRQSRRDLLYIRDEFFGSPVDCGKFIVHGHTPGETAFGAPGRLCLDTGAYASGVLTAGRFDGAEPRLIQSGARG